MRRKNLLKLNLLKDCKTDNQKIAYYKDRIELAKWRLKTSRTDKQQARYKKLLPHYLKELKKRQSGLNRNPL